MASPEGGGPTPSEIHDAEDIGASITEVGTPETSGDGEAAPVAPTGDAETSQENQTIYIDPHEAEEKAEFATMLEKAVNDRLYGVETAEGNREGGTAIGREFMGKLDTAQKQMRESAPVGALERVSFFLGGGKERGQKYREAKEYVGKTKRVKEVVERQEHKYVKDGAETKQLYLDTQALTEQIGSLGEEETRIHAQIREAEAAGEEAAKSEENQANVLRAKEIAAEKKRLEEQQKHMVKKVQKRNVKNSRDRTKMEQVYLPKLKEKGGLSSKVEVEMGVGKAPTLAELLEDYPQKRAELDKIASRASDPAEVFKNILAIGALTPENMTKFLNEQAGRIGRDIAQGMVERDIIKALLDMELQKGMAEYNARALYGMIDRLQRSELGLKASQLGLEREYDGAVMKQGWQKMGRNIRYGLKFVGAYTTGAAQSENFELDFDTRSAQIIEQGNNAYAVALQAARVVGRSVRPDNIAALTSPLLWLEDKLQWPVSKTFKRSLLILEWQNSTEDRRNTSKRRYEEKKQVIKDAAQAFDQILERMRQNNRNKGGGEAAPATEGA